jgi:hypothetical protein
MQCTFLSAFGDDHSGSMDSCLMWVLLSFGDGVTYVFSSFIHSHVLFQFIIW